MPILYKRYIDYSHFTGANFAGMQQPFNPAFFAQQNQGNDWQNPHGAKRQRPE